MQDSEAGRLIGQALGEYLLCGVLGVGDMAEVYQAMDQTLEREVAVKVLAAAFAAGDAAIATPVVKNAAATSDARILFMSSPPFVATGNWRRP